MHMCQRVGHKKTFWAHMTMKQYVRTFWWNVAVHDVDQKGRVLDNREAIRACLPTAFSIHYLPKEMFVELYRDNWERW